ncbi:hypothetical protein J3458_000723 [Metarhizium acridum]|uniref:uncharacterized protein n=1 Tax=Metarhizium acridum TaxID=92637 RepID=UPI001C6B52F6|nr:hypothetical protein J3458_000723 [Metarhizium acridum]
MDTKRIKETILRDGFIVIPAPEVGERVHIFGEKKYPFRSVDGLAFLRDTLADLSVVNTVESLFERSGLGMFKVFGPHTDTARAPLNRTTDDLLVVNVLHCGPALKIILYENSQRYFLDARPPPKEKDDTGLLEVSRNSIIRPGIFATTQELPNGGLVILDGRFFSTIIQGVVVEVAFADEKELKEWNRMLYPDSTLLKNMVQSMDTEKIKMNIKLGQWKHQNNH